MFNRQTQFLKLVFMDTERYIIPNKLERQPSFQWILLLIDRRNSLICCSRIICLRRVSKVQIMHRQWHMLCIMFWGDFLSIGETEYSFIMTRVIILLCTPCGLFAQLKHVSLWLSNLSLSLQYDWLCVILKDRMKYFSNTLSHTLTLGYTYTSTVANGNTVLKEGKNKNSCVLQQLLHEKYSPQSIYKSDVYQRQTVA